MKFIIAKTVILCQPVIVNQKGNDNENEDFRN